MKPLIAGSAVFAVTLAASTFISMKAAPPATPTEEHAPSHPDSTAALEAPKDSGAHTAPDTASLGSPHGPNSTEPKTATLTASNAAVQEAPEAAGGEQAKQVGRILGLMKAQDAAELMGFLGDDEVALILCNTSAKQAALLLGNMPRERAAALTRATLARKDHSRCQQ